MSGRGGRGASTGRGAGGPLKRERFIEPRGTKSSVVSAPSKPTPPKPTATSSSRTAPGPASRAAPGAAAGAAERAAPSSAAVTAPQKRDAPPPTNTTSRFVERLKADVGSHEARMQGARENEVDFLRLGDDVSTLASDREDMAGRAGLLQGRSADLLSELKNFESMINSKFDRLDKCNAEGQLRLNRSNPASIGGAGVRRLDTPNSNKLRS